MKAQESSVLMATPPSELLIVQELCESRGGRPGLSVLTYEPSGFRGRKELFNRASRHWSQLVPNTSHD